MNPAWLKTSAGSCNDVPFILRAWIQADYDFQDGFGRYISDALHTMRFVLRTTWKRGFPNFVEFAVKTPALEMVLSVMVQSGIPMSWVAIHEAWLRNNGGRASHRLGAIHG